MQYIAPYMEEIIFNASADCCCACGVSSGSGSGSC